MLPRLITIPFSHYCEKARWALDRAGVSYVEEPHLPGLHMRPMRKAGGQTVPVLVLADRALRDSAEIVAYADEKAPAGRKLYPADLAERREVERIETLCNDHLGKASRLLAYHHMLGAPRQLLDAVRPSLTRGQALAFPLVIRVVRPVIRSRYGVSEERAKKALETTRKAFAELGARLGSGRWLVGDGFTAADLTFASLAAVVVAPEGHPSIGPVDAADGAWREILDEMRATNAGAHVLRLYREERAGPRS
jgi:glutathione S-transferase